MGISIWQLAIVLGIVILLFGTKKLRNVGGDLGSAINSFKKAVKDSKESAEQNLEGKSADVDKVIEGEVTSKEKDQA